MVVDDLRRLPSAPLVVAEGSTLPAFAVSSGIAAAGRAVWLLPTFAFGQSHVDERAMPPHIRAWHAETYRLGLEHIEREAAEHGAPVIVVDGTQDLDEVAAEVESRFRDALDEGPRAESQEERRALLREANDQILGQCRGFLSRPWAGADEETFVRDFVCECDDPLCEAQLELTVADAAARLAEPKPVRRARGW